MGKELFAQAFHNSGPRADKPFVALNCAAVPETLIESELFGYVGGAFTGARKEGAIGKIQQAHGGTLFLDEIGDMPLGMQARLLRVLQERCVTPVGSVKSIPVDISLVCATHRVLRDAVARGEFREDLVLPRQQPHRLPARRCASAATSAASSSASSTAKCRDAGLQGVCIGDEVMRFVERHSWPGNVRQLQNVIRVAVALLDEGEREILPEHLPEDLFMADPADGEPRRRCAAAAAGRGGGGRRASGWRPMRRRVRATARSAGGRAHRARDARGRRQPVGGCAHARGQSQPPLPQARTRGRSVLTRVIPACLRTGTTYA